MSRKLKLVSFDYEVDVYPDQTNVTVTLTLSNGDEWRVQTDKEGRYSPELGCEIWVNDQQEFDINYNGYDFAREQAVNIAQIAHVELELEEGS